MKYNSLGNTDINVSSICLGTMMFGSEQDESEAFAQMDYAYEQGVNFLDGAEMYPIPTSPLYQGRNEEIIGSWLKTRNLREQMVVATKVTGPGEMVSYIRPEMALDRRNIREAVTNSLQRLQTDYIDLYQIHWPDRATNFFGQLNYQHQPEKDGTPILETLEVMDELVKEGLIRHVGLSNETAWGTMSFSQLAEQHDLPKCVSVQNPFSLLNRTVEVGLTEVLQRESVSLLPYSPLGFGVLSGKYLGDARPDNGRITRNPVFARYLTEQGQLATQAYVDLAHKHDIDPAVMALAWVNSRSYVASNIIGASSLAQLETNISSASVILNDEILSEIDAIHVRYPNPCP
ncbi:MULTISPECIES: NADP(H)-dependent aldo-keto reductase [unclassified Neptuniibacter]|uniref:NADP(H)-dependent aldo-keto reductase n=1 Tax=unclassified Neptuniibacter TaxID=2630693 RepID=UPI000C514248|nr:MULTISPECIES: NADP(H)-dependent aldo-keto reductase [unclassified Neptuniibacter]MAY41790.1 NADP(H)-dependent aldo-keto reductase [Oceanospirillaceae bacterium]